MPDPIKEAFQKVKEDMVQLKLQVQILTNEIIQLKRTLIEKNLSEKQTNGPADRPTDQQNNPADTYNQTDKQTVPQEIKGLKTENFDISTGNKGVPTDRQTDQQTDRPTAKTDTEAVFNNSGNSIYKKFVLMDNDVISQIYETKPYSPENSQMNVHNKDRVSQVLDSLDSLKKDLRIQFKRLTPQEMQVFSTIYLLTDQNISPDYTLLAQKTKLSESSIRDYIQKLIKKGIPLDKTKENNKRVLVSIPSEFKRMASLQTLLQLRNL